MGDPKDLLIEAYEDRIRLLKRELGHKDRMAPVEEGFTAKLERQLQEERDRTQALCQKMIKLEKIIDRLQLRNAELNDRLDWLEEENSGLHLQLDRFEKLGEPA